jgi:hypothetical protein
MVANALQPRRFGLEGCGGGVPGAASKDRRARLNLRCAVETGNGHVCGKPDVRRRVDETDDLRRNRNVMVVEAVGSSLKGATPDPAIQVSPAGESIPGNGRHETRDNKGDSAEAIRGE